jgi:hypothetical protein
VSFNIGKQGAPFAPSFDGAAAIEIGIEFGMFGTFSAPADTSDPEHEALRISINAGPSAPASRSSSATAMLLSA